jgi:predicted Zn finger-like uncharacterized protein
MIAICEECGAKYSIDPSKLDHETKRVRCNQCASVIVISKSGSLTSGYQAASQPGTEKSDSERENSAAAHPSPRTRQEKSGLGSREKRLVFLLLPLAAVAGVGIFYLIG